ncbi:HEAT repeat domain-containing protein [Lyngbya sp. CCY1209]|uniref:HEAT repeat domain-containing protein n=1 Tax=Lyngbya sp. CCY1209 TaxID=2886103 RepID=UPI002D212CDD|nr:HEAT repeat domain-containing protein [Lyngbya sp. CCY1209]MEB3884458.1 HEAT repeat domain-containing protein [Lyngbya sp. CCY1209]
MPRPSYGPETKKRTRQLLTLLLDYGNGDIDGDENELDRLRANIKTAWKSDRQLIIRTKIRFLVSLSKIADIPLTAAHIKESLARLEDFLGILEDHRPSRQGSETWHFSINFWYNRSDRDAILNRFESEWERRKSPPSQPTETGDNRWWNFCRENLEAQRIRRLTTNPLTVGDGIAFELNEIYLPVGLVERPRRERRDLDLEADRGSEFYEPEADQNAISPEQFLRQCLQAKLPQRIAIVGEPGAGKTTLLQRMAIALLENQLLPIWVSLADLSETALESHLLNDWLKVIIHQVSVPPELKSEFAAQFNSGRVWLLLDGVDEIAGDGLSAIARQLRGWLADAHILLTCRLNIWDGGRNPLEDFTAYRNLPFKETDRFIRGWFQSDPKLGDRLCRELQKPERSRIRDAVKNPLRLALLCRCWGLMSGNLPATKAALYRQFTRAIYQWKCDRFPTTPIQQYHLDRGLAELAKRALCRDQNKFRFDTSLISTVFQNEDIELLALALQLGWLNQVGVSPVTGEPIYAFYHPTFQEYFAAQAIADWRFFLTPAPSRRPIFSPHWREAIVLWLGRTDIAASDKEAFMEALIEFEDNCGGFYRYFAYFLAADGLAEFPECSRRDDIISQLLKWRCGEYCRESQQWKTYPSPILEEAKLAVFRTDRDSAIAGLEQLLDHLPNPSIRWQIARSLGKNFDPGNHKAIATLLELLKTAPNDSIRLEVAHSLGVVSPRHPQAIATLTEMISTTNRDRVRRKIAYRLGKIDPNNEVAIATLVRLIKSGSTPGDRAMEDLQKIAPEHPLSKQKIAVKSSLQKSRKQPTENPENQRRAMAALERRISETQDLTKLTKYAISLLQLKPDHPDAIAIVLRSLKDRRSGVAKRIVSKLKDILTDDQLPEVVTALKPYGIEVEGGDRSADALEIYKLLWHCARQLPLEQFYHAWNR